MRIFGTSLDGTQSKRKSSLLTLVSTVAAATLLTGSALAQPDYSALSSGLGLTGTPQVPGGVIVTAGALSPDGYTVSYPLVQQGLTALTIKLGGKALAVPPESVASGYLAVSQSTAAATSAGSTYLVVGAFPAEVAQLPKLEAALLLAGLPITTIGSQTAGVEHGAVVTVHVEGRIVASSPADLVPYLTPVLSAIGNPQLNTAEVTGPLAIANVPPMFNQLLKDGSFSILDGQILVFSLPFPDKSTAKIGTFPVSESLGVGQTVFISGTGYGVVNVELALRPAQVATVSALLTAGGFTFSSQSEYFTDSTPKLTFLHVVIADPNQTKFLKQLRVLGDVLNLLK